jgi:hypothetical protein
MRKGEKDAENNNRSGRKYGIFSGKAGAEKKL